MVYFLALNFKFELKYSLTEKKMYVSKMSLIDYLNLLLLSVLISIGEFII